jgi:hypothetical protein
MGTKFVPETSGNLHNLAWLSSEENIIEPSVLFVNLSVYAV